MAYRSLDTSPQTPMVWWKVFLLVIIPSLVVFLIMDLTWIYFVASAMFKLVLGSLMRTTPNPISGLLAWVFIITGIYYFASRTATSIQSAGLQGLLLGMVIYGTYEFTNHSVIKTWTWGLAFGDFAWGSFACACASVVQYVLLTWK